MNISIEVQNSENVENMPLILYKKILLNQVSYGSKQKKENNFIDDDKSNYELSALNGNFIKSIILLHEKKIDINDIYNEEGDTLLHLSCKFMEFNVIRILIEKFGANINSINKNSQTPFFIYVTIKPAKMK